MAEHRGEIVEQIVRKSGFSLKKLAERLGISRNTLYNRFGDPNLSYEFIIKVSNVIHYDFTLDFPETKEKVQEKEEKEAREQEGTDYIDRYTAELLKLERKYTNLLERYNKLLGTLVHLANNNELQTIKKEILHFIEDKGL